MLVQSLCQYREHLNVTSVVLKKCLIRILVSIDRLCPQCNCFGSINSGNTFCACQTKILLSSLLPSLYACLSNEWAQVKVRARWRTGTKIMLHKRDVKESTVESDNYGGFTEESPKVI